MGSRKRQRDGSGPPSTRGSSTSTSTSGAKSDTPRGRPTRTKRERGADANVNAKANVNVNAKEDDASIAITPDVLFVHSRSDDGKALNVIRKRGDALHAGQVRPVEEGKPLAGDLISLKPRKEAPFLFDVETHYSAPQTTPAKRQRKGPAQVSSDEYRAGWNSIWGRSRKRGASKPN